MKKDRPTVSKVGNRDRERERERGKEGEKQRFMYLSDIT